MSTTEALEIKELDIAPYEKVIHARCESISFECYIAIHNTRLGPALGGTRCYPYKSSEEALNDALRLAEAMTYKSAIAETGLGGGKGVIICDPNRGKSEEILHAYGEVLNTLKGKFIAAEDYGTSVADLETVRRTSPYVAALASRTSSGDPSRFTARGVYLGIKAITSIFWDSLTLGGKCVAIQGLGNVGEKLLEQLFWSDAKLIITDKDQEKAQRLGHLWGATVVKPEEIYSVECDIFAPCALGRVLNSETLPKLKCRAIAGAANNQLADDSIAEQLKERGILYAPDFVINAGGIINAAGEYEEGGYNPRQVLHKVDRIYDTLMEIFSRAEKEESTTNAVALSIAKEKLSQNVGKRKNSICF